MSKKLPAFKTDKQAERSLEKDLSEYISAENLEAFQFEFRPKRKSINLRISEELLAAIRKDARQRGMPYQRYIRQTLATAVRNRKGRSLPK